MVSHQYILRFHLKCIRALTSLNFHIDHWGEWSQAGVGLTSDGVSSGGPFPASPRAPSTTPRPPAGLHPAPAHHARSPSPVLRHAWRNWRYEPPVHLPVPPSTHHHLLRAGSVHTYQHFCFSKKWGQHAAPLLTLQRFDKNIGLNFSRVMNSERKTGSWEIICCQ